MLADKELFAEIEKILAEQGVIDEFEKENGKIKGRMMITIGEVPANLKDDIPIEEGDRVFVGTFDFYNASVGLVLNTVTMTVKGGMWVTNQVEDAEPPSKEWSEFFIGTLAKNIRSDESFGVPMYTFCTDEADFTVVPTRPGLE